MFNSPGRFRRRGFFFFMIGFSWLVTILLSNVIGHQGSAEYDHEVIIRESFPVLENDTVIFFNVHTQGGKGTKRSKHVKRGQKKKKKEQKNVS